MRGLRKFRMHPCRSVRALKRNTIGPSRPSNILANDNCRNAHFKFLLVQPTCGRNFYTAFPIRWSLHHLVFSQLNLCAEAISQYPDDRSTHVKRTRKLRLAEGLGSTRETWPQRRPSIGSRTSRSLHILCYVFRERSKFKRIRDALTMVVHGSFGCLVRCMMRQCQMVQLPVAGYDVAGRAIARPFHCAA